VQKRLNRSRCRFGAGYCGSKEPCTGWGQDRMNQLTAFCRHGSSIVLVLCSHYLCSRAVRRAVRTTNRTRRSKIKKTPAQRVARTACANAIVHFLLSCRLVALLPPSERPLKTSAPRILAYADSPPMQMSHKISGVTGPKFTKFVAMAFFSSTALTQQYALRSVHLSSNERGDFKK